MLSMKTCAVALHIFIIIKKIYTFVCRMIYLYNSNYTLMCSCQKLLKKY